MSANDTPNASVKVTELPRIKIASNEHSASTTDSPKEVANSSSDDILASSSSDETTEQPKSPYSIS